MLGKLFSWNFAKVAHMKISVFITSLLMVENSCQLITYIFCRDAEKDGQILCAHLDPFCWLNHYLYSHLTASIHGLDYDMHNMLWCFCVNYIFKTQQILQQGH